ncbi:MAG: hypothetical protein WC378_14105, partial [Opitutaceae bacterium]
MPWTRGDESFIRSWLVAGAFPGGLNEDVLAAQGGEAAIQPSDGMESKRSDGTAVKWHTFSSWSDAVGLEFSEGPKEGAVSYAFAKVMRKQAGRALL